MTHSTAASLYEKKNKQTNMTSSDSICDSLLLGYVEHTIYGYSRQVISSAEFKQQITGAVEAYVWLKSVTE
jgi:hypothetical protein